jgi:RNA polymerase sigma-70 factor (ECF subfamily)
MGKTESSEDEILVTQYRSGDAIALQKLVKRWHKRFCEKAYWLTKDADASKDIAQDSWKTIMDKIETLNDPARFQIWALRIVFTKAMDWMRSNQRDRNKLESYYKNYDATEEENLDNEALKRDLLIAIKALPTDQQMVLKLFYVEDYKLKELSDILKISVGTAKSRLFHAREKLKLQLKHKDYEMS